MTQLCSAEPIMWRCRDRELMCGSPPLIMGILNVTPDSFSDGNQYLDTEKAVARGLEMIEEGAAIVDVGGESTRPGAPAVSIEEETARVLPVIEQLHSRSASRGGTPSDARACISIDTTKAEVARRAVAAGADIINDVSALTHDPNMAKVACDTGAGVVLMHMLGNPRTMQENPEYGDVVTEVAEHMVSRIQDLTAQGMALDRLALDPGIGFGKTVTHNLQLLAALNRLGTSGRPVVVGLSRKSFLGKLTGRETQNRLASSIAALAFCVLRGAHVMRVHDVKESVDAVRVLTALCRGRANGE